ncbi:DUF2567 domain-containing protein [Phytomonospora sp. NPDC050363]|uniref:DUF2567 domain-containing protein n=1 Tax=Phytomonospora sp. NPDC050363 TaxID=3155642 RepID=UPI00340291E1
MTAASPDPRDPGQPGSATRTNDAPNDTAATGDAWASPYEAASPGTGETRADSADAVPSPAHRRSLGSEFASGGIVVGVLAVLGIPLALLWQALAPRVELVATETGFRYTTESPEGYAGDDGVFTFLGLGFGVVAAILVWALLRRARGPIQVTALVLGSIACQVVAWLFGEWWGRLGFDDMLAAAEPGQHIFRPPKLLMINFDPGAAWDSVLTGNLLDVGGHLQLGVLATMALAAVFVYTVLAGWSRYQSLSRETETTLPTMQTTPPDGGSPTAGRLPS